MKSKKNTWTNVIPDQPGWYWSLERHKNGAWSLKPLRIILATRQEKSQLAKDWDVPPAALNWYEDIEFSSGEWELRPLPEMMSNDCELLWAKMSVPEVPATKQAALDKSPPA